MVTAVEAIDHDLARRKAFPRIEMRVEPFRDACGNKKSLSTHVLLLQFTVDQLIKLAIPLGRAFDILGGEANGRGQSAHTNYSSELRSSSQLHISLVLQHRRVRIG